MLKVLCRVIMVCLAIAGCGTLPLPSPVVVDTEAAYTAINPYYLEFCALSEVQKKPGYGADIRGGVGGHSTIYLNGVCRASDGYPEIEVCPTDPASNGVGLSVNAHFSNANWVAIPGRDFFYHGDLKPGQSLTRQVYDATKTHAKRLGLYDAVRFHDRVFADMPNGYTRDAFKYEVSIATDYAIGYGRDRYCARVPLSSKEMSHVVDYLNALNRPYRNGAAQYEWSVLTDNCIHVAHNALSAIGFWPVWPVHRFILVAAFDFPVPKNEFINIMRRANDTLTGDLLKAWDDGPTRQALAAGQRLATRPGALATFAPVVHDNAMYDTDLRLIFYDEPIFGHYETWYRDIARQPRYTSLSANLDYYAARYADIDAKRQPLGWWLATHPSLRSEPGFPAFYDHFYHDVDDSAAAVGTARQALAARRN